MGAWQEARAEEAVLTEGVLEVSFKVVGRKVTLARLLKLGGLLSAWLLAGSEDGKPLLTARRLKPALWASL